MILVLGEYVINSLFLTLIYRSCLYLSLYRLIINNKETVVPVKGDSNGIYSNGRYERNRGR